MYAWRAESWTRSMDGAAALWGFPEMTETRIWKFHKGEAYYNTDVERVIVEQTFPPFLRPPVLPRIPASQQEQVRQVPVQLSEILDVLRPYAAAQL